MTAPLDFESAAWERGIARIAGLDEAGRGPLAGPVVAAAVVLRRGQLFEGAADSKTLPADARERLARLIRRDALAVAVGAASPREIERMNILRASWLAMRRALDRLPVRPERLLVDGLPVPVLGPHTALVEGDRRCHSIACASILAKVVRDRLMCRLDPRHPGYGWSTNMGYATPEHLEALRRLGPTPHHRATFAPVAQLSLTLECEPCDGRAGAPTPETLPHAPEGC